MTGLRGLLIAGHRHADREPLVAFEVTLWRALAVFRVVTLVYAVLLTANNFAEYEHPSAAWVVTGLMAAWTLVAVSAYASPRTRTWLLQAVDVIVTAACLLASRPIVGEELLGTGVPTLTITWMACPVMAVAIAYGRSWGAAAAVAMGACDLATRGLVNQATVTGTAIMAMAAIAVGHIARLARQAQERLRGSAEVEAANRERERLARGIHDSVLQVLALVQRRGAELGGEAAELGRLAGEQEAALRTLVGSAPLAGLAGSGPAAPAPAGMVDLRAVLAQHAAPRVTVSAPATGVWLPAARAREVGAAVAAAVENCRRHCAPDVQIWILIEDEPEAITVTVRDDGPGMAAGRLEEAEAQGRLGVAASIRGRLRDLGGSATITSAPGSGTEVELRLARTG